MNRICHWEHCNISVYVISIQHNLIKGDNNVTGTTNFAAWFLLGVYRSRQLDMGTSWYSWWKLIDFGVLRWKEGSHSCTLSCPDCWLLKRPYFHLRTPKSINFHQANQLVPMSNCWLRFTPRRNHAANFVVAVHDVTVDCPSGQRFSITYVLCTATHLFQISWNINISIRTSTLCVIVSGICFSWGPLAPAASSRVQWWPWGAMLSPWVAMWWPWDSLSSQWGGM